LRSKILACCAAAAALVAWACSPDQAAAPALGSVHVRAADVTSLVTTVNRDSPLAGDVVWTFTAGPTGATSSNSAVGLTISVPPGALSSSQTITVTALAGAPVAYSFEPHLDFHRGVTLTQNLTGTSGAASLVLSGAHFDGDVLSLTSDGLAVVSELVPAVVNPLTHTVRFDVGHFSGWIVASGKDGSGGGQ
jgi:hypothetical protein